MRRVARSVMALSFALVAAGCSGSEPPSANGGENGDDPPETQPLGRFVLSKSGCRYEGPGTASVGEVSLILTSEVNGPVQFDLWRMNGDHTYAELVAHVEEEQRLLDAGEPLLGHPTFATEVVSEPLAEARGETTMTFDAGAGEYGMACIRLARSLAAAGPIVVR